MKPQTAREQAKTLVALIRREYPRPRVPDDTFEDCTFKDWYCVGISALRYCDEYNLTDVKFSPGWLTNNDSYKIARYNDAGDFERAYQALEDYLTDAITSESTS